jgi:predicted porin
MQYKIASGRIMAGVSHTDEARPAGAKVTLYGLGYNHFLSKRTDLYAIVAHADNSNSAQYALGGAGYTGGFTSALGQDATAYQFGVRHRF